MESDGVARTSVLRLRAVELVLEGEFSMIIRFEPEGTHSAFARVLRELAAREEVGSLFALSCEKNGFVPELVDGALRSCPKARGQPIPFPGLQSHTVYPYTHRTNKTVNTYDK